MPEGAERRCYLVECYWPGVSEAKLAEAMAHARVAASELRRNGHRVEFVGSIFVPTDETVFCLFEGLEHDVRAASERAGIPAERVLESLMIAGGERFAVSSR